MHQKKIDKLLFKFIEDTITEEEIRLLEEWLDSNVENRSYFKAFMKINYLINIHPDYSKVRSLNAIKEQINKSKSRKQRYIIKYAVAAVIAVLLALPFIIKNPETEILEPIIVNNNIKTGTDKATLTLEDGTEVILEKGQEYIADNLISNGEELVYDEAVKDKQEIAYNYLTIPRGGQFFVKLSDGTQVWLNSETQLKYPTQFVEGQSRDVELVYGEAYFDVSPSTEHHGAIFKVLHSKQDIQVLGTEFNVSAYKDESEIQTTLVEGKVAVSTARESFNMEPNDQFTLNLMTNTGSINTVDVDDFISWKDGVFSFEGKPLKQIMRVIARWYDAEVIFINKETQDLKFRGTLSKDQTIEQILSIMKSNTVINYEIHDKTIIIK